MSTQSPGWGKWFGMAGLIAVSLVYFVLAGIANTDLSDGGYCLFMDEEITHGGVQRILHAPTRREFVRQVMDGDDHRYGRIQWNAAALISAIPERLWGEKGQIIATRMGQATFQWLAYVILVLTFLKSWPLRNAALLALVLLPSTPYYASMPKPEPLQMLFLALFLRYAAVARFCFGWHWVFMGLAFGAKISTAPLILPCFVAACLAEVLVERPKSSGLARLVNWRFWLGMVTTIGSLLVGWGLAIPMLFQGRSSFRKWLGCIIASMGHGHDDASVTLWTWLDFLYTRWSHVPTKLLLAITVLAAVLTAVLLVRFIWKRRFGPEYLGLVVCLVGLALLLPLMLKVKRVWPFYLHPSAALLCVGVFALCDGCIRVYLSGRLMRVAQVVVILLCMAVVYYRYPFAYAEVRELATRTQTPRHQARLREYDALMSQFAELSQKLGRQIRVGYDPVLYQPTPSPRLELQRYYGSFLDWHARYDVIVMDKNTAYWVPNPRVPEPGSAARENKEKGLRTYLQHVRGSGSGTLVEPIYVPVEFCCENILVLMREDIATSTGATVQLASRR